MEDEYLTISFRVRKKDVKGFQYIADVFYQSKRLKKPSIGLLAKTCLYVERNQFIEIQYAALLQRTKQS